jgi:signal transduction histidine kinase
LSAERTPLRTLIGGRWAVSWQGYLIAWPWAVLFIFSSSPAVWDSDRIVEELVRGVVVGTLAYVPVGIVMWLASISVLRNRCRQPVSIAVVALVGGVAWTARSLTLIGYLQFSGIPDDASPVLRLVAGFIQGALAFVLTAWLLAKLTNFHDERRRLLSELVQEELVNEHLQERIAEIHSTLLNRVRRQVDAAAMSLVSRSETQTPSARDVEALTRANRAISKGLSRTLWDEAAESSRVNPLVVVRSAAEHRPFAYWALLPGVLLGILVLPMYWSVPQAVLVVGVITMYALLISSIANAVCPRLLPSYALVAYVLSVVLLLATAFVIHAFIQLLGLNQSGGDGLLWAVAVNFGVFYPLVGLGAHISRAQQDVLSQLRRSISQAEIEHQVLRREECRMQRDLAYALHGGVQADLTASTMRAQQAIDQGDTATARQTLDEARDFIQRSWDIPDLTPADLRSTARTVVGSWEGFVNIALDINVAREPTTRTIAHVKEILLEGIGNAVRHGRAKDIAVTIDEHAGGLRITITDDGTGVTGSRIGLGSAMFDDIAPNAWSLTPAATGGSMLTVALPTATKA